MRVRVLKPIETGCTPAHAGRVAEDARALAWAAGDDRTDAELCPYRLALPAAPAVAARAEDVVLDLAVIREAFEAAARAADVVLVEAAGGLRVPIRGPLDLAGPLDMAALAMALDLPVLLVARARLGTINHTTLSLEAAARQGLRVVGVVVNHADGPLAPADRANLDWLIEHLPAPFLGEVPFAPETTDAGETLDLAQIWRSASSLGFKPPS